jgi:hypothetical protein
MKQYIQNKDLEKIPVSAEFQLLQQFMLLHSSRSIDFKMDRVKYRTIESSLDKTNSTES